MKNESHLLSTFAIGISFLCLGLSTTCFSPIVNDLLLQTHSTPYLGIAFIFLLIRAGSGLGSLASSCVLSKLPSAAFLINGVALLVLGLGLLSLPFVGSLLHVLSVAVILGFVGGWIDMTGNGLVLLFFGKKSLGIVQGIHACFGVGATLSPIIIWQVELSLHRYYWGVWPIAILSALASLVNLCCIFVTIPTPKKIDVHTKNRGNTPILLSRDFPRTAVRDIPRDIRDTPRGIPLNIRDTLTPRDTPRDTRDTPRDTPRTIPREMSSRTPTRDSLMEEESTRTPLLQYSWLPMTKDGYLLVASRFTQNFVVFFTSAFLFLFGGAHWCMGGWLWLWIFILNTTESTDAPLPPAPQVLYIRDCYLMTSLYWSSFALASIAWVRIKIYCNLQFPIILFGCLIGGSIITGLLLLTDRTAPHGDLQNHSLWLWFTVPLLGICIAGIFPAAISIPNDNRIFIRPVDKTVMLVAHSLGEIVSPLLTMFVLTLSTSSGVTWLLLGYFLIGMAVFGSTIFFSMCSKDLAEIAEYPFEPI